MKERKRITKDEFRGADKSVCVRGINPNISREFPDQKDPMVTSIDP